MRPWLLRATRAAHPKLVAAFMQTSSTYCASTIIAQQIRAGLDDLADAIKAAAKDI